MNISKRVAVGTLIIATILLLGIIFWPWLLHEIITPMALVVWLLLRMFVLSIAQGYYWGAIILMISIFLYRFLPQNQAAIQRDEFNSSNESITVIEYWRILFTLADENANEEITIKRGLAHLLVSFYASEQHTSANYKIYEAMQNGQIPLPEPIHAFLFSEASEESGGGIKKLFHSVRKMPQKWIRRWTGQERAERYQIINQVLCFMETLLEIKHDT
jgi:hypothetical protein